MKGHRRCPKLFRSTQQKREKVVRQERVLRQRWCSLQLLFFDPRIPKRRAMKNQRSDWIGSFYRGTSVECMVRVLYQRFCTTQPLYFWIVRYSGTVVEYCTVRLFWKEFFRTSRSEQQPALNYSWQRQRHARTALFRHHAQVARTVHAEEVLLTSLAQYNNTSSLLLVVYTS